MKWTGIARVSTFALVPLIAAAGCSGASSTSPGSSDGGGASDSGSAGSDGASSSSDSQAGTSSGSPPLLSADASLDDLCKTLTRPGECMTCCQGNHSSGAITYYGSLQRCVCGSGPCQTQCAGTYCSTSQNMPAQGSVCSTCINTAIGAGGSCVGPVNTACQADADCSAYYSGCLAHCP